MPSDEQTKWTPFSLVWAVVHHKNYSPAQAWALDLSDLAMIVMEPPKGDVHTATDNITLQAICKAGEERRALLEKLTVNERIELEKFKALVC